MVRTCLAFSNLSGAKYNLYQSMLSVVVIDSDTDMDSSAPVSTLLNHSLPSDDDHAPESKRLRRSSVSPEYDTIEKRISSDFYTSIDQLRHDVARLRDALPNERPDRLPNGDSQRSSSPMTLFEAADKVAKVLSLDDIQDPPPHSPSESTHHPGQVITLRSQTEKGTQQLYSGLQIQDKVKGATAAVDGRRLPNGFDLTDPATMDTSMLAPTRDRRLFGDIFRPHRNVKQLEMPRSSRTTFRSNIVGFSKEPNPDKMTTTNRHDYKSQQLPVSSWLNYNTSDQQSSRKLRGKSFAQGDLRAALMANDVAANEDEDESALFRRAFSSFAPTTDTAKAVVSDRDRDRQWWSKYGSKKLHNIFQSQTVDVGSHDEDGETEEVDDDFANVVSNFQSAEEEEAPSLDKDDPESVDEVLAEVSELLETVHSYQHIRSLDTRPSTSGSKPSSAESDSYELLRSQLSILVASLPPFAVAKLDGNKLLDLNISAHILVDTIDYRGTAQPDEYTLSRYRATQPAATVPRPQQPAAQPRPAYQTPTLPRYNTNNNLQAYAQNLGIAAARYGQTPSTLQRPYQTPYQQPQPGSTYSQPTVQQFQRPGPGPTPAANGYGSYSGSNPIATAPTTTTALGGANPPSQPAYQQHAQSKGAYPLAANTHATMAARSASPTKPPALNGQTQVPGQTPSAQGQYLKSLQQLQQLQQQTLAAGGSGQTASGVGLVNGTPTGGQGGGGGS